MPPLIDRTHIQYIHIMDRLIPTVLVGGHRLAPGSYLRALEMCISTLPLSDHDYVLVLHIVRHSVSVT
jgi:hypothetical protein